MKITLYSFGFKHGYARADMVWDVRFLPNPYWVPELKAYSGRHSEVALYVLDNELGRTFLSMLEPFLSFLLKEHSSKGRKEISLAIGCTGGRHRSVAVAEHLRCYFHGESKEVDVYHRDIDKE